MTKAMRADDPVHARVTRRFRASAEAVFDAWLNPELARQWFAPDLGEMTRVEIDARVGGTFWLVQRRGADEAQHTGEYLELTRPHRLVFTWRTPPLEEQSRVIIEIAPIDEGCELTLTHEMDRKWADYVDRSAGAWQKMADAIATLIEPRHE
jgi:uncharacterized protein YndB with AHSA1/START domain